MQLSSIYLIITVKIIDSSFALMLLIKSSSIRLVVYHLTRARRGSVMKKYLLGLWLLSCASVLTTIADDCDADSCDCENISRTYLSVRPQFQSVMPEMVSGFRNDRMHAREGGCGVAKEAVLFGGKSVNSDDLARYFFPFCKTSLIADEAIGAFGGEDLLTEHFRIYTQQGTNLPVGSSQGFRSQICLAPKQSVVGLGLQARGSFWQDEEASRGFWLSISLPIERVRNETGFHETIVSDGGGPNPAANNIVFANMTQALNAPDWNFGRISCKHQSKTGVADVELKIGYEWLERDPCHIESYLGILVPTGNKPNAKYLFEPIVGHGHHFGLMLGSNMELQVWQSQSEEWDLRLDYGINSLYLFKNTQCRSLDLKDRPWTRYVEMYANKDQAQQAVNLANAGQTLLATHLATPGINILTRPLEVKPGFWFNMISSLVLEGCDHQVEVGYNFFARQSECVKLATPWVTGPAIKHALGEGMTNPVRTINGNPFIESISVNTAFANYDNNVIQATDLDLNSASTPAMLTHTFYGAVTHQWNDCEYPTFANVGASYEFSDGDNNAALKRWLFWAKIGASF